MILIEITAAIDEFGTLRTFYLSDAPFQTEPTDTPADVCFDDTLIEKGSIGLHAFSGGRTGGASLLETGDIVIANRDGLYDAWRAYGFDGRPLVIRRGGAAGAYPSDFPAVLTGTVEAVEVGLESVVVRLRDKAATLDRKVLTEVFAGTNAGPVGLEGGPGDIKGRPVPRLYGSAEVIPPPCVNTSLLIYRITKGALAAISNVYVRGVALTFGFNHATSTALAAATITAGKYDTCLAEGLFRLGSSPDGAVTCDAATSLLAYEMTAGAILLQLAADAGLTAGEVEEQDFAELSAVAPYVVGLYLDGETTFRAAMDMVAASVGGWYAFDALGVLRGGQVAPPTTSSWSAEILADEVGEGFTRQAPDGAGVPVWRVKVRYRRFWTIQGDDLAGSVSDARRAELGEEYRVVVAEAAEIKIKHPLADELVIDTLLVSADDAETFAEQQLSIHGVQRDLFVVPISLDLLDQGPFDLMWTVRLNHPRFGLAGGRNLRINSRSPEFGAEQMILELWG